MNIAYVTYEYPPDTADGGIATYVRQAARVMLGRGHHVEVFAASRHRDGTTDEDGLLVHRVYERDWYEFNDRIVPVFARRHAAVGFDVLEGTDHCAHAEGIVRRFPATPLVVKLHTPQIICRRFAFQPESAWRRLRTWFGAVRRGGRPWWEFDGDAEGEREKRHALEADEVASPSTVLGKILIKKWGLDERMVAHVPNPFVPNEAMLRIPADTRTNVVTYIGRVDFLKGMVDLTAAIPRVLRTVPDARFRIVGKSGDRSPIEGMEMVDWMKTRLCEWGDRVEFVGPVPLDQIPEVLAGTDVCVIPSQWDNFPNTCLEAMSAARGVVGTRSGGMVDMLGGGLGKLVHVRRPRALANGIVELLQNPERRQRMGEAARARVIEEYNADRVGRLMEESYGRAIGRRRRLGPRGREQAEFAGQLATVG